MNWFNFFGWVVFIIGGSGVLGGVMVKGLGELGCKLVVLGWMVFIVDSRVEELKEEGFEALLFIVDVLDWENLLESK